MTHSLPTRRSSDLTSAISKIDRPSGGGGRIAAADDATPAAIGEIGGEPDRVPDEEPRDRRCRQADEKIETAEDRSEEHTSELQSLMRISYAVFCLKK